jgi:hypothetical protein
LRGVPTRCRRGPLDAAIIAAPVGVACAAGAARKKAAASCGAASTPKAGITTEVTRYPLPAANEALADLRAGCLHGAAVLVP